jgi:succinylglutamate desuccinylase
MNNKILIISETHGIEKIGTRVMEKLKPQLGTNFKWIIGNKEASSVNKRYIKFNMNRIAPGDIKSKDYETRRVSEILSQSRKYDYTFDIHGTNSKSGIFTIVTNPKIENILLALALPIDNIVIWNPKQKKNGPITKFVNCGVEIECGSQNSLKTKKDLLKIIRIISGKGIDFNQINFNSKNVFRIYGKLINSKDNKKLKLKDFKKIVFNKKAFYPILSRQYKDIACYKMEKVDFINLLSY